MKDWSINHKECQKCNRTDRPHKGHGLCKNCYETKRDRTNEKSRLSQLKYRLNNKEKIAISQRKSHKKKKNEIFSILGNKCNHCGFSDERALQIDHVNGGGTKEVKEFKLNYINYYQVVINSIKKNENKYQLLCANCNWIKRHENNECS